VIWISASRGPACFGGPARVSGSRGLAGNDLIDALSDIPEPNTPGGHRAGYSRPRLKTAVSASMLRADSCDL